ncbi:MAG: long-chain fatty acid transporter [Panacagrimonas sp.]|jgi:long-chain fatty acid transport protein|nr:long-chain fatty acid transporter [Panacagrimonas sp.]
MSRFTFAAVALCATCSPAHATLGVFEHGNGIQSLGMGGVTYSFAGETTALGGNPAHALSLGDRYDVGIDFFTATAKSYIHDNALGPDEVYKSDGRSYYMIPQGGISKRLGPDWAFGMTMLSAGLGPDYDGSPYARFPGASDRVSLYLASTSIVSALAYRLTDDISVGASLNTGYQVLEIKGLGFLANDALSVSPDHVTNQGKDGVFTFGASLGFTWRIKPWLTAGAAYRTKNFNAQHDEYRGLVARGGKLELPSIYGGGIAIEPALGWVVVVEAQRYTYRSEAAFRNGLAPFEQGERLGGNDGPGFGFKDQNAYKLGISYRTTPRLTLRAGFTYGTGMVSERNTLFGALGCLTPQEQYSLGATYLWRDWEITGYGFGSPTQRVNGDGSIPEAFGGGEADVSDIVFGTGFSFGRRFGARP